MATNIQAPVPNYVRAGEGGGRAVLFVHPLGADLSFWDGVFGCCESGRSLLALDLPGSGRTPLPDEPLTVDHFLDAIETVRQAEGLERFALVGCAVGGMVAARYAARSPSRILAVVMCNPGVRITPAATEHLAERAQTVRRDGMAALLPAAIANAFEDQPEATRRDYEARFVRQDAEGYAQSALAVGGLDVASDLKAFDCPLFLLRGAQDLLFPQPHTEEIDRLRPDAVVQTFADGAHFIPYQRPERFARALDGFLEEVGV